MSSKTNVMYLTEEGLQKIKKEHANLVTVKRKEISKEIAAARELGDLSENSAWQRAREQQSFIEGRIEELEQVLKNVKLIKKTKGGEIVSLGCKVKVHIDGGEEEFHIVGGPEANPLERKISHESPLGKALIGKKVGEVVEIEAPVGKISYKIVAIE